MFRKPHLLLVLLFCLSASCTTVQTSSPAGPLPVQDTPAPAEGLATPQPALATTALETPASSNCLGEAQNPIARAIANEYSFTTYDEVMGWFCSGAEFEDIFTALQTEQLVAGKSGVSAEELLQMLADGFSWDEIWRVVGLTE